MFPRRPCRRCSTAPERLAAIPMVGLVVHFIQRKRIALTSRAGTHGPEVGGLGASIAAALSTMTVVAPGVLAPEPPEAASQSPPVVVDASGQGEAGVTDGPSEAPAERDSIPGSAAVPPPPRDDPPEPVVVGPAEVDVGPEGVERTREEAGQQPVSEDLGPVFFGLNPPAVGEDVDRLGDQLEDLRGAL